MKRIAQLDVLRGIAVLGLLVANVYFFAGFDWGYVENTIAHTWDKPIEYLHLLAIDGRFRSLFCLLFGAALILQFEKYHEKSPLKKRLTVILVLGLLHGFFIWPGDILFTYAIAGFIAVRCLGMSAAKLFGVGACLTIVSTLCVGGLEMVGDAAESTIYRDSPEFGSDWLLQQPTDLLSFLRYNAITEVIMIIGTLLTFVWNALGIMMLGMAAFKKDRFVSGYDGKSVILLVALVLVLSGVSVLLQQPAFQSWQPLADGVVMFNGLFGALLVVHVVSRLMAKGYTLHRLSQIGRLALTCYMAQSLMMVIYFFVLQPEAYLTFNRINYLQLAFVGIAIQLIFCSLYLKFFQQGPLEWLVGKLSKPSATSARMPTASTDSNDTEFACQKA